MYQGVSANTNKLLTVSFFLLVLSIAAFVVTRSYLVLLSPVAFLYVLLVAANWKYAYWLLLFTISLSVQFALPGSTFSLSFPDEPMCWIFSLVFVLLAAGNPRILPRWWWDDPVLLVVILQFAWLLVAVAFSSVFLLSVKFLAAKVWYLICFFVLPVFIFKDKQDLKKAFLLLLLPVATTAAVISARLAVYHFSFAAIGAAVGNLYINHVEYAAVVSIFYPLLWVAYPLTAGSRRWVRVTLFILILFFIPVIFLTYARVAILAVMFAAVVGVAIRVRLVNIIMPALYGMIAIGFVMLLRDNKYLDLHPDYNHTVMHKDYSNHLSSTFQGRDVSSMERLYRWVAAIRMSVDRPITGYGPHAFVYHYKPYAITMFKTFVSNNREHSTTHNYFLYMLAEQGWPSMLLYALLVIVVLAQAQKTYHRFTDRFYKYCTLGLAMAFAASFVNNFFSELIETHKAGALFYLIIALLMILRQKSKEEGRAEADRVKD
jgi:O-antigen ligase